MAVGLNADLTKQQVDVQVGQVALKLNIVLEDVDDLKFFLDGAQDADLEALGYTPEDTATLRSAVGDMDQLRRIYQGLEALADVKDFRQFMRRCWGSGFIAG